MQSTLHVLTDSDRGESADSLGDQSIVHRSLDGLADTSVEKTFDSLLASIVRPSFLPSLTAGLVGKGQRNADTCLSMQSPPQCPDSDRVVSADSLSYQTVVHSSLDDLVDANVENNLNHYWLRLFILTSCRR